MITKATCINPPSYSLIDHICFKNDKLEFTTGVIPSDISEHFFTFLSLDNSKTQVVHKEISSRQFTSNNLNDFKLALRSIGWESVTNTMDSNLAFNEFWNTFSSLFDIYFPLKTVKFNKNFHKIQKFLTSGLLKSRMTKNTLHKKSITESSANNIAKFKTYRNLYNILLRKSKILHYQDQLLKNVNNPKKTWDLFNEITGRGNPAGKITEIRSTNKTVTNSKDIANHFNDFFSSIGHKISNQIDNTNISPISYLENSFPNAPPDFNFDQITPTNIIDILKILPAKKSTDIDGISNSLLKFIKDEISVPIAHIFNESLKSGIYPDKFKTSRVIPIFKSGDCTSADNYRPISLISSIAKILDKIVAIKLTNHLEINKLLYKNQFGFQKNSSTEYNLLNLTNFVSSAINENKFCIGIFLDLKKAFDVVSHKILLSKLKK